MSVIVVDTSIWIDFFNGEKIPSLEQALRESRVLLSPLVIAELTAGAKNEREREELLDLLDSLPIFGAERAHWIAVGDLRKRLKKMGLSVSTPDTHIAQCTMDIAGELLSSDKIFRKISIHTDLKLCEV